VTVDKKTSGKEFWERFKEERKMFEDKIYMHENINDFKRYFKMQY
jgi:hypothetical protein